MAEEEPRSEGEREDPLSHGDAGEDAVDEMGGKIGHPSGAAGRAEAAALATVRDELVLAAVSAVDAREAADEETAVEERAQFSFDEGRKPRSRGVGLHRGEDGLEVLGEDAVEHRAPRLAPAVEEFLSQL